MPLELLALDPAGPQAIAASLVVVLAEVNRLVYAPLLLVAVSLVYAGTRHEDMRSILRHAASFGGWTVAFMASVAVAIEAFAFFQ